MFMVRTVGFVLEPGAAQGLADEHDDAVVIQSSEGNKSDEDHLTESIPALGGRKRNSDFVEGESSKKPRLVGNPPTIDIPEVNDPRLYPQSIAMLSDDDLVEAGSKFSLSGHLFDLEIQKRLRGSNEKFEKRVSKINEKNKAKVKALKTDNKRLEKTNQELNDHLKKEKAKHDMEASLKALRKLEEQMLSMKKNLKRMEDELLVKLRQVEEGAIKKYQASEAFSQSLNILLTPV